MWNQDSPVSVVLLQYEYSQNVVFLQFSSKFKRIIKFAYLDQNSCNFPKISITVGVQSLARAKSLALLTFGANIKYLK